MADLLAHVLAVVTLLTVAGWWVDWIEPRWIAIAIGGVLVPDLSRLSMLLDPALVERTLGIPFGYHVLETLGGVCLVSGMITVWFERHRWRRVYGLLVLGGVSHLALDALRVFADGRSGLWLFPVLPSYRPPTPNLFVSADPVVTVVAAVVTATVLGVDRLLVADSVW